jgi:hypothetical protein
MRRARHSVDVDVALTANAPESIGAIGEEWNVCVSIVAGES